MKILLLILTFFFIFNSQIYSELSSNDKNDIKNIVESAIKEKIIKKDNYKLVGINTSYNIELITVDSISNQLFIGNGFSIGPFYEFYFWNRSMSLGIELLYSYNYFKLINIKNYEHNLDFNIDIKIIANEIIFLGIGAGFRSCPYRYEIINSKKNRLSNYFTLSAFMEGGFNINIKNKLVLIPTIKVGMNLYSLYFNIYIKTGYKF